MACSTAFLLPTLLPHKVLTHYGGGGPHYGGGDPHHRRTALAICRAGIERCLTKVACNENTESRKHILTPCSVPLSLPPSLRLSVPLSFSLPLCLHSSISFHSTHPLHSNFFHPQTACEAKRRLSPEAQLTKGAAG